MGRRWAYMDFYNAGSLPGLSHQPGSEACAGLPAVPGHHAEARSKVHRLVDELVTPLKPRTPRFEGCEAAETAEVAEPTMAMPRFCRGTLSLLRKVALKLGRAHGHSCQEKRSLPSASGGPHPQAQQVPKHLWALVEIAGSFEGSTADIVYEKRDLNFERTCYLFGILS